MDATGPCDTLAIGQTRFFGSVVRISARGRGSSGSSRRIALQVGRSSVTLSVEITGKTTLPGLAQMPRCQYFGRRQTSAHEAQTSRSFSSKTAVRFALVLSRMSSRWQAVSDQRPQMAQSPVSVPSVSGWGISRDETVIMGLLWPITKKSTIAHFSS